MRRTIDVLFSAASLTIAALLVIAGGLLTWASSGLSEEVNTQLRQQRIVFPQAGPATADPNIGPYIDKYAGQQLTTGEQAKAYAEHYITVRMLDSTGGRTYSELTAAAQVNPDDAKLAELAETAFRGETQRATLLNAHHNAKLAQLTGYSAWAAFAGALVMLILGGLGFRNLQQPRPERTIPAARVPSPAAATR